VTARTIAGLAAVSLLVGLLALSGCGSSTKSTVPGGADTDAVRVIQDWANELRAGDVQAASDRFQVPAVVQNGTPPLRLTDRQEVVAFNESLPCGAKLTEATMTGKFTIATFELTERPGPGECGSGVGETAKTAFVIHDGHITEWRRVADINQGTPTTQGPIV
jgi:limonene-1,2-epoxide hydrolase